LLGEGRCFLSLSFSFKLWLPCSACFWGIFVSPFSPSCLAFFSSPLFSSSLLFSALLSSLPFLCVLSGGFGLFGSLLRLLCFLHGSAGGPEYGSRRLHRQLLGGCTGGASGGRVRNTDACSMTHAEVVSVRRQSKASGESEGRVRVGNPSGESEGRVR
jgi:hypothetical protein